MFGIGRVILAIMLINHLIACSWYGIGMYYDDVARLRSNDLGGSRLRHIDYQYDYCEETLHLLVVNDMFIICI